MFKAALIALTVLILGGLAVVSSTQPFTVQESTPTPTSATHSCNTVVTCVNDDGETYEVCAEGEENPCTSETPTPTSIIKNHPLPQSPLPPTNLPASPTPLPTSAITPKPATGPNCNTVVTCVNDDGETYEVCAAPEENPCVSDSSAATDSTPKIASKPSPTPLPTQVAPTTPSATPSATPLTTAAPFTPLEPTINKCSTVVMCVDQSGKTYEVCAAPGENPCANS